MYTAMVATRFIGTGTQATPFRPAFGNDYPSVSWEDIVGIPSGRLGTLVKNVNIVRVTIPDAALATLTAALADANYVVLWNERTDDVTGAVISGNKTSILTAPQLSAVKTFLTNRGYTAGDLAGVTLPITRENATIALIALFKDAT